MLRIETYQAAKNFRYTNDAGYENALRDSHNRLFHIVTLDIGLGEIMKHQPKSMVSLSQISLKEVAPRITRSWGQLPPGGYLEDYEKSFKI